MALWNHPLLYRDISAEYQHADGLQAGSEAIYLGIPNFGCLATVLPALPGTDEVTCSRLKTKFEVNLDWRLDIAVQNWSICLSAVLQHIFKNHCHGFFHLLY
jgi:hypothetical protein